VTGLAFVVSVVLSATPEVTVASIVYPALSALTYTQINVPPRITPAGVPGVATLPAGLITTTRYMSCDQPTSTGRTVMGINELWTVDANGTDTQTFVASSSEYEINGTSIQRIEADYSLSADL
jgi:hypothetical protein